MYQRINLSRYIVSVMCFTFTITCCVNTPITLSIDTVKKRGQERLRTLNADEVLVAFLRDLLSFFLSSCQGRYFLSSMP